MAYNFSRIDGLASALARNALVGSKSEDRYVESLLSYAAAFKDKLREELRSKITKLQSSEPLGWRQRTPLQTNVRAEGDADTIAEELLEDFIATLSS